MPVAITLQVAEELVQAFHEAVVPQSGSSSQSQLVPRAVKFVRDLGVDLEPLFPGAIDSELQRFFIVTIEGSECVDQVLDSLRECHGIDAAYLKPPDALP